MLAFEDAVTVAKLITQIMEVNAEEEVGVLGEVKDQLHQAALNAIIQANVK